ncbi:MAG: PadR family transcriptional regulator [Fusobacteria bacterium]|nr:PadR family transcriptional regulator [Fusobacteriota bacterium]
MARESKTKYILLGMLAIKNCSGYDIKQMIDVNVGYFWQESNGQIYPTLKKLEECKLIERIEEDRDSTREKKIYTITLEGKRIFQNWVEEDEYILSIRNEFLLKLTFGTNLTVRKNIERLKKYKRGVSEKKTILESMKSRLGLEEQTDQHIYWYIQLDSGILMSQAMSEWCDLSISRLEKLGG